MAKTVTSRKGPRLVLDISAVTNGFKIEYSYGTNRKYVQYIYEPAAFGKASAFLNKKLRDVAQSG